MSEDSRLRKLLAAALVELRRLDGSVYQQARDRVEAFAPERFAEILARHDDLYKPPEPAPFAEEDDNAQAAAVDAVPEVAEPREPADPPAILCRPAAAARRRLLCRGYAVAAAAAAQRRRRRKTDGGRCVFSTARPGTPARTSGERCVFCSPQRMLLATRRAVPLQHVKADLRKLERKASWVHDRAHERLRRHLPRSEYKKVLTPKNCCRGHGEDMCVFSCRLPGTPARVSALDSFCIWCDPDRLAAAQMRGEHGVATQLRFFREHCPEAYAKADRTLRDLFGDDYAVTYFGTGRAREGQRMARTARRRGSADWTEALNKRKLRMQAPEEEAAARRKYRKLLLDDRKKVQNSFFPGTAARQDRGRGDAVPEEVGPPLPPADYSDLSRGLESWCLRGSWAMCKDCGSLQPRPLHDIDLAGDPKVDLPPKQCRRCSGNRDHYVPQPDHVPEALRGLSPAALAALSPLEVDVGPETRSTDAAGRWNGYRKKMKLITFLWAENSVKQRVKRLQDRDMRIQAGPSIPARQRGVQLQTLSRSARRLSGQAWHRRHRTPKKAPLPLLAGGGPRMRRLATPVLVHGHD